MIKTSRKIICLSKGKKVFVDKEDYYELIKYKWSYIVTSDGNEYAVRSEKGKTIFMHRQILKKILNTKLFVDHKDRNGLNNCKSNLRICNNAQNQYNVAKKCTSKQKYKGVRKASKNSYMFRLRYKGKRIEVYGFKTELEAVIAYNAKALELHKEFAYINPIEY